MTEAATKDIDQLFMDLAKSPFRRRFRLGRQERYLGQKGLRAVLDEGADFLSKRLAAASPPNDGKQTPFKGHHSRPGRLCRKSPAGRNCC
jgi:hypothetical protein